VLWDESLSVEKVDSGGGRDRVVGMVVEEQLVMMIIDVGN
jgi:hypothetical protein